MILYQTTGDSSFLESFLQTVKQDPEGANTQSGSEENLITSNIVPDVFSFNSEAARGLPGHISNEEIKPSRGKLVTNNGADRNSLNQTKIAGNIHHFGDTNITKLASSEFFSHLTKQSRESKVHGRHNLSN